MHINVRMQKARDGLVKVVWGDAIGGHLQPYHLFVEWVNKKAEAARSALKQLYEAYLHPRPDFDEALVTLAARGRDLRNALFHDYRPQDDGSARNALEWFEQLPRKPGSVLITSHTDPIVSIPWGLVHGDGN